MRRLRILAPLVVSLALSPQAASAGTLAIASERTVVFQALAGERNDVTLSIDTRLGIGEDEWLFPDVIVTVTDSANAVTAGAGCHAVSANTASCPAPLPWTDDGVRVVLELADTADEASTATANCSAADEDKMPSCDITVNGGEGNDTLVATHVRPLGADVLLAGGTGDDELDGDHGVVTGGQVVAAAVALEGGAGADTLRHGIASYRERTRSVFVTLNGKRDDGEPGEGDLAGAGVWGITGGSGADLLVGNAGANSFQPGAGDDIVRAGGGQDGVHHSFLPESDGDDRISGGEGDDDIATGGGADVIRAGPGEDSVWSGSGRDRVYGDRGRDLVLGSYGRDVIAGGPGRDYLDGGAGDDVLVGGPGRDALMGEGGADVLDGGGGDRDLANYRDSRGPITVTLDNWPGDGRAGENDNVRRSVEVVEGSMYNDRIVGNCRANALLGNDGRDVLAGRGGEDSLWGGFRADILRPGSGRDRVDGDDTIYARGDDDTIYARDGARDRLRGGGGRDRARVDRGLDQTSSIERLF